LVVILLDRKSSNQIKALSGPASAGSSNAPVYVYLQEVVSFGWLLYLVRFDSLVKSSSKNHLVVFVFLD
jgi:hypothetical protein